MKEKMLITSFFAANLVDVTASMYAHSSLNFKEIGFAADKFAESGELHTAAMVSTGVIALIIGSYALSNASGSRLSFSYEKAIKIGNLIYWGANVINIAQIAVHLAQNS
jgi:hypothetical protein